MLFQWAYIKPSSLLLCGTVYLAPINELINGEEGMHHVYTVWHSKLLTSWQDMLNLDSAHYVHQVHITAETM